MRHTQDTIMTNDGLQLVLQNWKPQGNAKAILCLIHGYNEHSNRYQEAARAFTQAGIQLLTMDLRGHGRSEGPRGHTPSIQHLIQDLELLLQQRDPTLPYFLYGHSLGGALVLNYGLQATTCGQGIIATGPWLRLYTPPPAFTLLLAKVMSHIWPTFTQSSNLPFESLSRDPSVVQAYVGDPLIHNRITARFYTEIDQAANQTLAHAHKFHHPMLIIHGAADRLIDPSASREFYDRASSTDKTLILWPDLYHEVHNEPEKDQVIQTMIQWVLERC